ncbi:asparaginase [Brachybacterium saurashtrense]|uniref:Asparaginase n=1 Tax=Brachybacterium saurashtrense TaxID=556288 RepID=A0A345YSP2_9MICO|nr:asparaginase [Brachybacterium saurashtrense]AXK46944.1 asparaginase [Brachybacterium saurashtrense]RRR22659.1 asparaginase [Brachybacterium saurashtrense]
MTAAVALLSLGGTIFMAQDAAGGGARPDDTAGERLLATVAGEATLTSTALANISSSDVRPHHLRDVLEHARAAVDGGAAGVVLTHGTDTLEETAFLLERYWDREAPLVVTGAMRPASDVGADGPANLRDAVRAATAPSARGLGVLVVFDGHAHLADRVTKASSRAVSAFASEPGGPLALVERQDLRLLQRPLPRAAQLPGAPPHRFPAVPLLAAGLDEDFALLDHLPPALRRGLVIDGVGMGHVSPAAMPRLRALLAEGVPVVVAARPASGGTSTHHYAYPGSEVDLLAAGAVMAGLLPATTARLLLQALLADGADGARIRAAFEAYAS